MTFIAREKRCRVEKPRRRDTDGQVSPSCARQSWSPADVKSPSTSLRAGSLSRTAGARIRDDIMVWCRGELILRCGVGAGGELTLRYGGGARLPRTGRILNLG